MSHTIECKGCTKPLLGTTILKHLSHKIDCKRLYCESEIQVLIKNSKQRAKSKEKSWKRKDYLENKEKHLTKRAQLYKKEKVKECQNLLERKFKHNRNTFGIKIKAIQSNPAIGQEIVRQVAKIDEMVHSKFEELQNMVNFALENFKTYNIEDLTDTIYNEWRKLDSAVDVSLGKITPQNEYEKTELLKLCEPPRKISNLKETFDLECKSCGRKSNYNTILKHLSKSKRCMDSYKGTSELKLFKTKAKIRESDRLKKRYQNEKDVKANEYKKKKKDIENSIKYFEFKKAKKELSKSREYWRDRITGPLKYWRMENCTGSRCRKEIEKLKQKKVTEIDEWMVQVEEMIQSKLKELDDCLEEVDDEVKNVTGHFKFDNDDKWKKLNIQDSRFCSDMFRNLGEYIEEEMVSLYVTVLQNIKDACQKYGFNFESHEYDEDLYKDTRMKIVGAQWVSIPRNVILK